MAIRIASGKKSSLPKLQHRQMGITDDTEEVYIGTPTKNLKLMDEKDKKAIENAIDSIDIDTSDLVTKPELNSVTEQLADNLKYENQENFIETLKRHMQYKGTFNVVVDRITPYPILNIIHDIGNNKGISYRMYSQGDAEDFLKLGSGRFGDLSTGYVTKESKNWDSRTGNWVDSSTYYTSQVGATMTIKFTGGQLKFKHFNDNRGGLWEFIIDGDLANPVTITTYSSTSTTKFTTIFADNKNSTHTIVGTFKGDDPSNPPSSGAGTSRGWCNTTTGTTFQVDNAVLLNNSIIEPLHNESNKEYAFLIKKPNTNSPTYWMPYHGTVTAFKAQETKFIINGVTTTLQQATMIENVKELKIIQVMYARVPEYPSDNLLKITTVHTFNGDGTVNIDGKLEVLKDTFVQSAYGMMFPVGTSFSKKIISALQNSFPTVKTDTSNTRLTEENDKATSYISLNDSTYKNLGVAVTINNPKQSLRQNKTGKPSLNNTTWIEHRDVSLQKLYPKVFENVTLNAGQTYRWSMTFFIANFEGLYDLF